MTDKLEAAVMAKDTDIEGPHCPDILIDRTAFDVARGELMSLVSEVVPPPDLIVVVRDILLGAFDSLDNLVCYRSEVVTAGGAMKQVLLFEPSETLLGLLAAFRAQDWDTLIARHHLPPESEMGAQCSQPSGPA